MAGGMRGGGGVPLSERSRGTSRPAREAPAAGACGRHCWVVDPPGDRGKWPGLLVEWRQDLGTWSGRVVYAVTEPGGGQRLVETWLPAALLHPAL